ncbi:hypothetical protein N665_1735s0012 [Sinapis alba]|nr:hypothetical protein N665_1735s0012 [Sinapis alba]
MGYCRGSPEARRPKPSQPEKSKTEITEMVKSETPSPGMNGAIEVSRPDRATVFEFGSVAATGDRVTLEKL